MRALTTTELEHCAGGIETVIVTASRIYGSSSGGFDYNSDAGNGGCDASNASNCQNNTLAHMAGFGPQGSMGFFQYVGWCVQNPAQCVGLGADTAVSLVAMAWEQGYQDFSAAMSIALYSHIGIQGQAQLDNLSIQNTGQNINELRDDIAISK